MHTKRSLTVETTTGNTGQGAPAAVTSSTAANAPSARAYTLAQLIHAYMANYAGADRSIGSRLDYWHRTLGERPAAEIHSDDVADALAALMQSNGRTFMGRDASGAKRFKARGPIAGTTADRVLTSLGSVYKWARRRRLLPRGHISPCRGVERAGAAPHRVRYLDDAERARLLAACRVAPWSRLYLLVLMAITTGARRGELLALRWRDLDLERRTAAVATSKNGEPRVLVLVAPVLTEIERVRSRRPDDFVFASDKRPGRAMRIERSFRDACAGARITNFRFHDLRHTAASYLAMGGASLLEIAETLGHKQLQMVRRYAHLSVASRARLSERVFAGVA
jgi:integrase